MFSTLNDIQYIGYKKIHKGMTEKQHEICRMVLQGRYSPRDITFAFIFSDTPHGQAFWVDFREGSLSSEQKEIAKDALEVMGYGDWRGRGQLCVDGAVLSVDENTIRLVEDWIEVG